MKHKSVWAAMLGLAVVSIVAITAGACGGSGCNATGRRSRRPRLRAVLPPSGRQRQLGVLPAPASPADRVRRVVGEDDPDMPENADICVVNADGTGLQQLTVGHEWEVHLMVARREADRL